MFGVGSTFMAVFVACPYRNWLRCSCLARTGRFIHIPIHGNTPFVVLDKQAGARCVSDPRVK